MSLGIFRCGISHFPDLIADRDYRCESRRCAIMQAIYSPSGAARRHFIAIDAVSSNFQTEFNNVR